MAIKRLVITKLFGQFDYDIPLDNPEGLKILTGPNGYGKTAVLNIIDSIVNNNFGFFYTLPFECITLFFEDNVKLMVYKNNAARIIHLTFKNNIDIIEVDINVKAAAEVIYTSKIIQELQKNKVYFIKEQRLFDRTHEKGVLFSINECQKQLKSKIESYIQFSETKRNELDATFPMRLLENNKELSENDYNKRFESVSAKQHKLKYYGLADFELKIPNYTKEGAKILSAYLDDIEEKLAIYDGLVEKLNIFTQFIEKRVFTNKSIHINKTKGFIFKISYGTKTEELALSDLSSGEQHQIILLFELIFNLESGSIVLIDEPEISLHVAWMRMFISDLLEILKLHNAQAIVVTHSPQIIDVHSNLQYDLYAAQNNKKEVANAD